VAPRPIVAGLLSLFVPGLGQLYAGAVRRALVVWLATNLAFTLFVILIVWEPGLVADSCATACVVFVAVANVVDAARTTRRVAATGAWRRGVSRWPAVTAIGLLFLFGVQQALRSLLKHSVGEAFRQPASSMAPGLLAGDWIMAVPIGPDAVTRGAVLVFHAWEGEVLIKRVVGLPGDTIGMRANKLEINGRPLREPYAYIDPDTIAEAQAGTFFEWQRAHLTSAVSAQDYHPTVRTWGPLVVPPDSVFVLGDNRENSLDSRYRGFVARSAFFRRPTGVYFSWDPDANKVRWRRIGLHVE
jgi:signal peptidase I